MDSTFGGSGMGGSRVAVGSGDSCSSAAAAGTTRDSNSESPTCIGGRLAIRVGWSPGLGGLHALGDSRWCMGGKVGDDGDVLGRRR